MYFRMCDHTIEHDVGAGPCYQQVEIAYGFLAASKTPGCIDLFDPGHLLQFVYQFRRDTLAKTEKEAPCALAVRFNRSQHLFLELCSHARQIAQLLFAAD